MKIQTATVLWLIVISLGVLIFLKNKTDQTRTPQTEVSEETDTQSSSSVKDELPDKTEPLDKFIKGIPLPLRGDRPKSQLDSENQIETLKTQWSELDILPQAKQYQARVQLLSEWVSYSPTGALDALKESPPQQRAGLISTIAYSWGKLDAYEAARWALALADQDSSRAFAQAIKGYAKQSRADALNYAQSLPTGEYKNKVYKVLAQELEGPPVELAKWLMPQDDHMARNLALLALTTKWSRSNPKSAEAWTLQLQKGNARDFSLQGLSRGIVSRDAGKAFYYAQQIETPAIQKLQMRGLVTDFARTCLPCHRKNEKVSCLRQQVASLPNSVVPEEMKSRVLKIVQENFQK